MSDPPATKKMKADESKEEKTNGSYKFNATKCAQPFRKQVSDTVLQKYESVASRPLLVGFLASDDPAAKAYARWTKRAFEADHLNFELREVKKTELINKLEEASEDKDVHGIMIYYPCFGNLPSFFGGSMDNYIRDSIPPKKDVEGLCHAYRHALYHNKRYSDEEKTKKNVLPCTPLAIVKLLEHLVVYDHTKPVGNRLEGKVVSIINRSEIVGHPLAALLANDGAIVYSIDIDSIFVFTRGSLSDTTDTPEIACQKSHVIVCGVPSKSYQLPSSHVSNNTVVINVSPWKCVDEAELLAKEGVVYVPTVGKVTVAMLERNLLRLFEQYHVK